MGLETWVPGLRLRQKPGDLGFMKGLDLNGKAFGSAICTKGSPDFGNDCTCGVEHLWVLYDKLASTAAFLTLSLIFASGLFGWNESTASLYFEIVVLLYLAKTRNHLAERSDLAPIKKPNRLFVIVIDQHNLVMPFSNRDSSQRGMEHRFDP